MLGISPKEFYADFRNWRDNKRCIRCGEWRPKAEFASTTRFAVCDTCKAERARATLARYQHKKRGNTPARLDP